MSVRAERNFVRKAGFGLVEIMVGLAIGMIATLAIVQVVATFEGQKRASSGSNDAQTNGNIALYMIRRQAELAGYGLPIFSGSGSGTSTSPLNCGDPLPVLVDAASPLGLGMSPVTITDGGTAAGATDRIVLRSGPATMGAVPVTVKGVLGNLVSVDNNLACNAGDPVVVSQGATCVMSHVAPGGVDVIQNITLLSAAGIVINSSLACMSGWTETTYEVGNKNLQISTYSGGAVAPVPAIAVSGIVNIQAQYGYSNDPKSGTVIKWLDASDLSFGNPLTSHTARNQIKAIRVAVVARNGQMEKENVTAACSSTTALKPTGLCAWEGSAANPAPKIDLSKNPDGTDNPDWRRYRYRVFETIIPLRNVIWNNALLS